MRIAEFALERYFARWEFAVRHLLCASDLEPWPMTELLALADPETRALWDGLRLGYTESTGHPLLRAEIATLYETVTPDDVLVFAGAEEAIFCLANVLMGPGDHAVVTWPGCNLQVAKCAALFQGPAVLTLPNMVGLSFQAAPSPWRPDRCGSGRPAASPRSLRAGRCCRRCGRPPP